MNKSAYGKASGKQLSADDRERIIKLAESGKFTTKQIAIGYNTSTRTVQRILEEQSIHPIHLRQTVQSAKIMAVINKHKITVKKLNDMINAPALCKENIQTYLNNCTKQELAEHFYISGLIKLGEIANMVSKEVTDANQSTKPKQKSAISTILREASE